MCIILADWEQYKWLYVTHAYAIFSCSVFLLQFRLTLSLFYIELELILVKAIDQSKALNSIKKATDQNWLQLSCIYRLQKVVQVINAMLL